MFNPNEIHEIHDTLWVCGRGINYTSEMVVDRINRATGSSLSVADLERTYPVGSIYQNGWLWFQRVAS